ncbi:MAG: NAD-dependent epimerase/dehydratase family protein [Janthinobacterium lividum]
MQRVVVLGASGFLGSRVLAALAASGWAAPVAVSRNPFRAAPAPDADAPPPTERLACDAASAPDLLRLLAAADAVVNCTAGAPSATLAVARALAQAPATCRIVHVSSMAVYGDAHGLVGEDTPLPGDLGGYAGGKVAAERALSPHAGAVMLRPGCVFGPGSGQWTARIARLLHARRLGDLGAAGDGACNLAPVADVVAAVLAALHRPVAGGAFNLALPDPPSWNAFLTRYAVALGAVPVARIPARRLRLESRLAVPLHAASLVLRRAAPRLGARVPDALTPSLLALMRQDITLDHRRTDARLGIRRTSLDEALREAAASLRPHAPLPDPAQRLPAPRSTAHAA